MTAPNLDILVSLRCTAHCKSCIEFCNMQAATGLDYGQSDMSMAQIDHFIIEVRGLGRKPVFSYVYLTGGEPLLHPQIEYIASRCEQLLHDGYIEHLLIGSNLTLPIPSPIAKYVVNYGTPNSNPERHNTVLIHPSELGTKRTTHAECSHYRKDTWVLSYLGMSVCCAGDAYMRLFGRGDLFLDHLPKSVDEFPCMDEICRECPFIEDTLVPFERDRGAPVSAIYQAEAAKNRAGRVITRRYRSELPKAVEKVWPKIAWVCCTFNRPKQLGRLIHSFLQQDYPPNRKFLLILDDAGQYENQSGDGWELISLPRRFASLGQKRNAATALVPFDTEIICPVDDDEMYLPHAMQAHATALHNADWSKPSAVYEEKSPGVFVRERYHGHSASWGYRREVYQKGTGYSFINRGEDGGLQMQLESPKVRVADPLKFGFGPYMLCSRFQQYHTHNFGPGDYERNPAAKQKFTITIEPGYRIVNENEIRML